MSLRGSLAAILTVISSVSAFELHVQASKTELFQGEPVALTYTFSYTQNDALVDFRFAAPTLSHFRVLDSKTVAQKKSGRELWTKCYTVVPMQSGNVQTGPAAMNVAKRTYKKDAWGQWMPALEWSQERYDALTLFAAPAPSGVQGIGDFVLSARTDSNQTRRGEPVHLTLSLRGCGDLSLSEPLRMAISGVDVFEEGRSEAARWKGECYYSERNQTFALVGQKDFTIPEVQFRSFDPKTNRVVRTRSVPIEVNVSGLGRPLTYHTTKEEIVGYTTVIVAAAGGFAAGMVLTLLLGRRRGKTARVRVDSMRRTLIELLKHLDDREAQQCAEAMEKHLYEGAEVPDEAAMEKVLRRLRNKT